MKIKLITSKCTEEIIRKGIKIKKIYIVTVTTYVDNINLLLDVCISFNNLILMKWNEVNGKSSFSPFLRVEVNNKGKIKKFR